jgi:curli biogenesis system outer membrane secretion channel CsgG
MMGGVSPPYTKGYVTIDIRMIETNTGRIVRTETVGKRSHTRPCV